MNVIHKNCDKGLANDKNLPRNSYIITYLIDDEITYDIVQANSFVEVFDHYYDQLGQGSIQKISWTNGTVNPKTYSNKPKKKGK